jgi:uncharacterized protein (TIGR03437 family)
MKSCAAPGLILFTAFAAFAQQTPITFTYQINGPLPPAQTFSITSANPSYPVSYLSATATPSTWLQATLSSTTTPCTLTVSVLELGLVGLAPGNYSGSVTVTSPFSQTMLTAQVILTVTPAAPPLSLSVSGLVFNAFEDGPVPPAQTLVVGASNAGVAVSSVYTSPVPKWLILYNPLPNNPTSPWNGAGTAPVTIDIAVDPTGLSPGTYSYAIPFNSSQGSYVSVDVSLLVAAPALSANPTQLQFQCPAGLANPAPQSVQVQGSGGMSLNASVSVSVPWLTSNLQSATTPFTLSVQPDCAALAAGTYAGKISLTDTTYPGTQTVNVDLTVGEPILSITGVTNAALPAIDSPPATVTLAPRSMATIFGSNLADSMVVSPSPWSTPLGGTEVHLAGDTCFDPTCDLVADLIYVSPAQINFLVPDTTATGPVPYRIVLVRDSQRIDDQSCMLGGPGRVIIDPSGTADYSVVFQVGYDCLFSASLSDPSACGMSWTSGQDRAAAGAVIDAISGQLINTQNPAYQGRLLTLWMTGLKGGVTLDATTGLRTANIIAPVGFGVSQFGKDIEGTSGVAPATAPDTPSVPIGTFMSPMPLWAGESPQFVGLDQVNVAFPTCTGVPAATSEKRYDAFLTYTSLETGTTERIYIPFDVRVGDPDCQWVNNKTTTTITLNANSNPSTLGQATILTATVIPATATGAVTFFDGANMLGSSTLSAGVATLSVTTLAVGTHSINVVYNGDSNCVGSTAVLTLTVNAKPPSATTVFLATSTYSAIVGQAVVFSATVSPASATGTVTFSDGSTPLGSGTLNGGVATLAVSTLAIGSHSITAVYNGDSNYSSSVSTVLTVTIAGRPSLTYVGVVPSTIDAGGTVTISAVVFPSDATGTVTFIEDPVLNCHTDPATLATVPLSAAVANSGAKASFSTVMACTGEYVCALGASGCNSVPEASHPIHAVYDGDAETASSSSGDTYVVVMPLTTAITAVSNQNPSSRGNPAPGPLFTATVTPSAAIGSVIFAYGTPTGMVQLSCQGAGNLVPLVAGQAVCNAAPNMFPAPGDYVITVMFYPQDGTYAPSTIVIDQTVTP